MKRMVFLLVAVTAVALAFAASPRASQPAEAQPVTSQSANQAAAASQPADEAAAAIATGKLPGDYRDWKLIAVAREEGKLDDIRAFLGNDVAIGAFRRDARPFPEGTIIARVAWSLVASEENDKAFGQKQSFVAGQPKNGVQFMVKDSRRYAATGGWGYSQFDDGKPVTDLAKLQGCFECHALTRDRDFVFSRYAK